MTNPALTSWQVYEFTTDEGFFANPGANVIMAGPVFVAWSDSKLSDLDKEYAQLIAKAVNHHAQLVKALKHLLTTVEPLLPEEVGEGTDFPFSVEQAKRVLNSIDA